MVGSVAQMVALVCHGNAALQGLPRERFEQNSTTQFCRSIRFLAGGIGPGGQPETLVVAETADAWLERLETRKMRGLRLYQTMRNAPEIPDRMAAGFVGGGPVWRMEALRPDGSSEFWQEKWELGDRNDSERRIWKVTYGLLKVEPTKAAAHRPLEAIATGMNGALIAILDFAERHQAGFVPSFTRALAALEGTEPESAFHKDLAPPGVLPPGALSLLSAAQHAWVFGGMGSWNDMSFEGAVQAEYDRVSEALFRLVNEAIAAAATSSCASQSL